MKILLAPDKFKGALSAQGVCDALTEGIRLAAPEAEVVALPLADGGEGTAALLTQHSQGTTETVTVHDPLFRPIAATYGLSGDGQTAYLEMAQASGWALLEAHERDCLHTTTLGTGELIRAALERGAKKIILGIGGSATNDLGIGMASALGYRFYDADMRDVKPIGANLAYIRRIDTRELIFDPNEISVQVACDVDNPLFGPQGAAYVYAPQKGASPEAVAQLDEGLRHLSVVLQQQLGTDVADLPGAGAAGGLGGGAVAFLGAQLVPGATLVMQQTHFLQHLAGVDLVITGEGKLDAQTAQGKVVSQVAAAARAQNIPVAAVCGTLEATPAALRQMGLTFASSVLTAPMTLEEALPRTRDDVMHWAFQLVNLFIAAN
ncbi:glycerate kinase [Catalinimonas alkaloidigena]|uniref:Glycerate kinase n=1 Tax=Catalinimonas alkaloidigena TaxID=1075417 RepID=A0A1G9D8J9_9BACT|nr:glycerate kinase [Catalinimonas alkaloidigena]SDK60248.1 glycerate kinase [Catalinimonas alkaloidigena]